MKRIILHIATSMDGRIASPDGGLGWLKGFSSSEKIDYGYKDMLASVDTIVMGGKTYRELLNMDIVWPYPNQHTYVVSHHKWRTTQENVSFITENIIDTISELRNKSGKDIWLTGGGELISMLLAADLVDQMQIVYMPIVLGEGIILFPEQSKESQWNLMETKHYDSDVLMVRYKKIIS
ncbi:dihydrofolate reductase family protein [Dysgonomonas sp. UBA7698]|uniref:dihydrofolate reductase family protein n=1 Tax=Dysgonomonas sp. UBA7698 TaxID=1946427 RepID=UPI0025C62CDE|nr:dihydrofolate reductase family protein [Dysgonomonas sp. UBA7698]